MLGVGAKKTEMAKFNRGEEMKQSAIGTGYG